MIHPKVSRRVSRASKLHFTINIKGFESRSGISKSNVPLSKIMVPDLPEMRLKNIMFSNVFALSSPPKRLGFGALLGLILASFWRLVWRSFSETFWDRFWRHFGSFLCVVFATFLVGETGCERKRGNAHIIVKQI